MRWPQKWALLFSGSIGLAFFTLGVMLTKALQQLPVPPVEVPVPSASSSAAMNTPSAPVPPTQPPAPPTWTQADLRALSGRWVGTKFGDAIPRGPLGGSITPMGVRAVFEEGRAGSKTPWNVTIWAPRQDHMTPETISMGCGFYVRLHEAEGGTEFRTAYCRGYGLAAGASHATTIRLTVRGDGALRVQVGSVLDVEVARP